MLFNRSDSPSLDSSAPPAPQTRDQFTTHLATNAKTQQSSDISTTVMIISCFKMTFDWKIFPSVIISWETDEGNSCFVLKLYENGWRECRIQMLSKHMTTTAMSPFVLISEQTDKRELDFVHSGTPYSSPKNIIKILSHLLCLLTYFQASFTRRKHEVMWGHRLPLRFGTHKTGLFQIQKEEIMDLKRQFQPVVRTRFSLEVVCFTLYKNITSLQIRLFLHFTRRKDTAALVSSCRKGAQIY